MFEIVIFVSFSSFSGVWKSKEELKSLRRTQTLITPRPPHCEDDDILQDWGRAVQRSLSWYSISDWWDWQGGAKMIILSGMVPVIDIDLMCFHWTSYWREFCFDLKSACMETSNSCYWWTVYHWNTEFPTRFQKYFFLGKILLFTVTQMSGNVLPKHVRDN